MKYRKWSILVCVMLITVIVTADAFAIPAFARRYKISCSTCHAPFPKLKEYGEDFAGAGMILKEEEKERDYVSAGDDLLWLNRTFPVAARFEAFGVYDQDHPVENDLQSPWGLKLLSGGTLYKNIGYYFYFYMSERGEVAGVEDAYIHFDNVFGANLDFMVGQFQTSDPLMKRELRLTFEDYMIYKVHVGDSKCNLTYDRGVMALYGIDATGTEIVGFVVNGNGKPMADEDTKKFDVDSDKNLGVRLNQDVAGLFSVGGFYYLGKENLFDIENEITYWGPDMNIRVGPIEVTAQYLEREDTNPTFTDPVSVKTTGSVVEAVYSPKLDKSRWYLIALYNAVESDMDIYNYETATLAGTYLVARNLRFTLEYTRDLMNEKNRMVLGMVSGF
ncbi:hypothetical protein HQ585_20755 [candidate division KSB1 bacterium]|nr:hypothetical protein [candidate division KSB1 bacterium]